MKTKREQELDSLKKSINEESVAHEAAMSNLRQKHSHLVEELNGQLETTKKVIFCAGLCLQARILSSQYQNVFSLTDFNLLKVREFVRFKMR